MLHLDKLNEANDKVFNSMNEFAYVVAELQWTGSKVYYNMQQSKQLLENIAEHCQNGKIDTASLGKLVNVTSIRRIKSESTNIDAITRYNRDVINFRFTTPQINEDTRVYRIHSFRNWVNFTTNPVRVSYNGPPYVIHNSTNNCTKGIEKPEQDTVYETCKLAGYTDPRLQSWMIDDIDDPEPEFFKTKEYTYISCIFRNITFDNKTEHCPPYIVRVPILKEFRVDDYTHNVNVTHIRASNEIQPFKMIHINESLHHESYDDLSRLVSAVKHLNKELNVKTDTIQHPWKLPEFWTFNAVSLFSVFLTLLFCVFRMIKPREEHNESVVINNIEPEHSSQHNPEPIIFDQLYEVIKQHRRQGSTPHQHKYYPSVSSDSNLTSELLHDNESHYKCPKLEDARSLETRYANLK